MLSFLTVVGVLKKMQGQATKVKRIIRIKEAPVRRGGG